MNLLTQAPWPQRVNEMPQPMNQGAVSWAFAQRELPMMQRAVLVHLAYHADAAARVSRGAKQIADDLGTSTTTVKMALQALVAAGLLQTSRQYAGCARERLPNEYVLVGAP